MTAIFADAWFFIAWLDRDDARHDEVMAWVENSHDFIVTTRWVLAEVANALGGTTVRRRRPVCWRESRTILLSPSLNPVMRLIKRACASTTLPPELFQLTAQ